MSHGDGIEVPASTILSLISWSRFRRRTLSTYNVIAAGWLGAVASAREGGIAGVI